MPINYWYKPILGAIFEPLDKLAIGLSVSKVNIVSSDNEQQWIYRDSTSSVFSDTDTIVFIKQSDSERDKFPLTVALGLAYFASPRLVFSGDIIYYAKVSDEDKEKEAIYNFLLGAEYYFTDSFAARIGFFSDMANTPQLSSNKANQQEHVDIYGASLSLSIYQRT